VGRKVGIDVDDVVAAAVRAADRDGLDSLTLTLVASELGIKTPSLYNHVEGLPGLRRLVTLHAAGVFTGIVREALDGLEGGDALRSLANADRRFAQEHPGLYQSFLPAPRPGEDDELYDAMAEPVYLIGHVLLEMGIPQSEAIHLLRALRSLLHGFLDLEAKRGFGLPVDIEESYSAAVELIITGIEVVADSRSDERQP